MQAFCADRWVLDRPTSIGTGVSLKLVGNFFPNNWHVCVNPCSDEETDLNSLIKSWLRNQPAEYRSNLENWIGDYFSKALQWVLKQVSWPRF